MFVLIEGWDQKEGRGRGSACQVEEWFRLHPCEGVSWVQRRSVGGGVCFSGFVSSICGWFLCRSFPFCLVKFSFCLASLWFLGSTGWKGWGSIKMGENQRCVMDVNVYTKILLHAAKYFYCAVNGVLLGSVDGSVVRVKEAVALMHGQLGVTPLMDAALSLVENKSKESGMMIVGYYQANELLNDKTPSFVATRIAERLREITSSTCLAMVDNTALTPEKLKTECALQLFVRPKGDTVWAKRGEVEIEGGSDLYPKVASAVMDPAVVANTFDFDDHCDDVSRDYFNPKVKV